MSSRAFVAISLAALLATTGLALAQVAEDPAAAEREYRLAQRLYADRSPDAEQAFERTVTLAPRGTLADDALVDLARLRGAPDWPEDLGGLDPARAAKVRAPLEKVVDAYARGDRILEARYRLALCRLAPIEGRDPARAREELIALASGSSRDPWVVAGRYALGVLDEQLGAMDRAAGAFARIVVERPDSDIAPRASAGFARTRLAAGSFGVAAGWLQDAIEGGVPPLLNAGAQRELALAALLSERDPSRGFSAAKTKLAAIPTVRGAGLLASAPGGLMIVLDKKSEALQMFDANGTAGATLPLRDVTAIATDTYGRVFAATKDKLVRWDSSGPVTLVTLAAFGSPSALAADATGAIWIADRKGDRIGRWTPGSDAPATVRESKGAGVTALAVSGGRVVAAEEKTGKVVAVDASGAETVISTETFRRPVSLAIDAAGRIAVLDAKAGTVTRLTPQGKVIETLGLDAAGVSKPLALGAAPDGAVRILDGATGAVAVAP